MHHHNLFSKSLLTLFLFISLFSFYLHAMQKQESGKEQDWYSIYVIHKPDPKNTFIKKLFTALNTLANDLDYDYLGNKHLSLLGLYIRQDYKDPIEQKLRLYNINDFLTWKGVKKQLPLSFNSIVKTPRYVVAKFNTTPTIIQLHENLKQCVRDILAKSYPFTFEKRNGIERMVFYDTKNYRAIAEMNNEFAPHVSFIRTEDLIENLQQYNNRFKEMYYIIFKKENDFSVSSREVINPELLKILRSYRYIPLQEKLTILQTQLLTLKNTLAMLAEHLQQLQITLQAPN